MNLTQRFVTGFSSFKWQILVFIAVMTSVNSSLAQSEAFARHYTSKPFIFQDERQLFYIEISNPTESIFTTVQISIQFSGPVDVRGLDENCSYWVPGGITEIICALPKVKANSFYQLDYYIVGDIDNRPSFSSVISVSSKEGDIEVKSQAADTIGFADGVFFVEGPALTISVARDVLRDTDQDGVSDINENIIGTDPENPSSNSHQNALIDVVALYSDSANDYHQGKIDSDIQTLITTTNQFFKRNEVGITLRLAALGEIEYSGTSTSIETVFNDLTSGSHSSFENLDNIISGVGADIVLFFHPLLGRLGSASCGISADNSEAVMGDFYADKFSGRLISVVDTGPGCSARVDIVTLVSTTMGLVPTREENPNGGTFPFSSGFKIDGLFATKIPSSSALSTPLSIFTERINKFSNPSTLCNCLPCGISRHDIANGADAVYSLNATAHLISQLTEEVFPRTESVFESITTIDEFSATSLIVRQFNNQTGVLVGDWVNYTVEAQNTSSILLRDMKFSFSNFKGFDLYRTGDSQCVILAATGETLSLQSDSMIQGHGTINCYVKELKPGQVAGFSYSVNVEELSTIPTDNYVEQFARVNGIGYIDSIVCTPIYENVEEAQSGSDICRSFSSLSSLQEPAQSEKDLIENFEIDLTLLPTLSNSVLSVPFIRADDNILLSAQFKVHVQGHVILEIIGAKFLDSDLEPETQSVFNSEGTLTIKNVSIAGKKYVLDAQLIEGTNPVKFDSIVLIEIEEE
ncbi:MAG: hypothetical protein GKR91_11425 [Pseudomonadales bacterium]|nr:hypothetical protein [Pseudomonadales bacterium]